MSPAALAAFGEVLGDGGADAAVAALAPDERGWRVVTLSFEHELAAAHRLAGFGGQVEVLSPSPVRERLVATAQGILERYGGPAGPGTGGGPGSPPSDTGTGTSTSTAARAGPGSRSPSPRSW